MAKQVQTLVEDFIGTEFSQEDIETLKDIEENVDFGEDIFQDDEIEELFSAFGLK